MQFKLTAFKKAAKRYADRHSLPLNEAQQAFSEILGFKTVHEALKRLEVTESQSVENPPLAAKSIPPESPQSNIFWSGLTFAESKVVFNQLMRHPESFGLDSSSIHSVADARCVFNLGMHFLDLTRSGPVTSDEFLSATSLESILDLEERHNKLRHLSEEYVRIKEDDDLERYFASLYGFKEMDHRLNNYEPGKIKIEKHGIESHRHTLIYVNRLISAIASLEAQRAKGIPFERSYFWCDLTLDEFKILVGCLVPPREGESTDRKEQALMFLHAALSAMAAENVHSLTTSKFVEWLQLSNLDALCLRLYERNGMVPLERTINISGRGRHDTEFTQYSETVVNNLQFKKQEEWLEKDRPMAPLVRYLLSIPEYELRGIVKSVGQSRDCKVQHDSLLHVLGRLFDFLDSVEKIGGASSCKVSMPGPGPNSYPDFNVQRAIKKIIFNRQHPRNSEFRIPIYEAIELADFYQPVSHRGPMLETA